MLSGTLRDIKLIHLYGFRSCMENDVLILLLRNKCFIFHHVFKAIQNSIFFLKFWTIPQFWHIQKIILLSISLSLLAVNFEDVWWPMQTIWIQMKPHNMWGFIWDPNCLTFRLNISKLFGRKQWFVASFERKKYLKKLPSMQRDIQHTR